MKDLKSTRENYFKYKGLNPSQIKWIAKYEKGEVKEFDSMDVRVAILKDWKWIEATIVRSKLEVAVDLNKKITELYKVWSPEPIGSNSSINEFIGKLIGLVNTIREEGDNLLNN